MGAKRTKTMAGLVLLAGVMLTTSTLSAKTETVPLPTVEFTYMGVPGPETSIWTTDGQIQHIRRLPYELAGAGDDITVTITGVCNHNRSLERLDGNFWGHDQSVEMTWAGLTGTFRGTHSGKTIDWVGYSTHVYHGVSGDFEGWKLRLNGTWDFANKQGVFEGTLMVTGAVHADPLTASTEAATVSAGATRDPVSGYGSAALDPDTGLFEGAVDLTIGGEGFPGIPFKVTLLAPLVPDEEGVFHIKATHTFDFGDGNTLTTSDKGVASPTDTPGLYVLNENLTITSGMGCYEGASGELRVHGELDLRALPGASFDVHGVISR